MHSLLLLLIAPTAALTLSKDLSSDAQDESPELKVKFYFDTDLGYTADVLNKSVGEKGSLGKPFAIDRTEKIIRKLDTDGKKHAWVMFVGDSNMRGVYTYWVQEQAKKEGVKFVKSKQFNPLNPWSDQEAVLQYPDGFEARLSYRFIHGSEHEYKFKMTNFHSVSKTPTYDHEDKEIALARKKHHTNITMDEKGAVQPSEYALWAAAHGRLVNFEEESPHLAKIFKMYESEKPKAVVLSEGWGGIPGCGRFEETTELFKSNPEIKYVWIPVFVTNRQQTRHKCFSEKIAALDQKDYSKGNFKFVDVWEYTSLLPEQKEKDDGAPVHLRAGGDFMKQALTRMEDAIDACGCQSPQETQ